MANDAGHADWLQQLLVKLWLGPVSGSIATDRDDLAIGFGFAARDQHDATIGQRGEHRFVRIAIGIFIGHGDWPACQVCP